MKQIEIDYLGNRTEHIEELADLWTREWSTSYNKESISQKIEKTEKRLSTDKPPFILVATIDKRLVGTAALFVSDLDKRPTLTPWLAGVFVKSEYRSRGFARKLIKQVLVKAKGLNYEKIYLHTEEAQGLYEKLGWEFLEHTTNDNDVATDIYYKYL